MLDKFLPPTDNLYKFIAISGLMFLALSIVPYYFSFQLGERKLEHTKNLEIFNIGLESKMQKFEIAIKQKDELLQKANSENSLLNNSSDVDNIRKIDGANEIYDEILEGEFRDLPISVRGIKAVKKL